MKGELKMDVSEYLPLRDVVFNTLRQAILRGEMEPGERLMEIQLSQKLGVSRTPIREALTRLEAERLIKQTSSGMVVVGISKKDVEEMYAVKKAMEPYATELAVKNMSAEGLEKLREILEQQEFYVTKSNAEKIKDLDTEFHDIIYSESASPTLESILSPLHHKLMRFRKVSLQFSDRSTQSVEEHKQLFEAIEAGDAKKAKELMAEHVNNACKNIMGGM